MPWPPAILALLIGATGWYYLFYSKAAHRLGAIEGSAPNARRIILRRANGLAMICLAALLYIGMRGIDPQQPPRQFVLLCWFGVLALLVIVIVLALLDLRLTGNLRRQRRPGNKP